MYRVKLAILFTFCIKTDVLSFLEVNSLYYSQWQNFKNQINSNIYDNEFSAGLKNEDE